MPAPLTLCGTVFFPHKNVFDARDALGKDFSLFSFMENTEEELIKLICAKDEKAIEKWLTSFSGSYGKDPGQKSYFHPHLLSPGTDPEIPV